jgi:hypothetical protein
MEVIGQLHDPAALPPRKVNPVPMLGGPQSRSGRGREERNLPMPGIESGSCSPYLVAMPTELFRLLGQLVQN